MECRGRQMKSPLRYTWQCHLKIFNAQFQIYPKLGRCLGTFREGPLEHIFGQIGYNIFIAYFLPATDTINFIDPSRNRYHHVSKEKWQFSLVQKKMLYQPSSQLNVRPKLYYSNWWNLIRSLIRISKLCRAKRKLVTENLIREKQLKILADN